MKGAFFSDYVTAALTTAISLLSGKRYYSRYSLYHTELYNYAALFFQGLQATKV